MAEDRDTTYQHVLDTARSLVEVTAGVLESDAASLWRYDDERAHLVARFPENRAPKVLAFAEMPEVGASILARETSLYTREAATAAVRRWMEQAGITIALRLPVETPEVPRHFLGLSWETAEHPPVDTILPVARRLADHIALALARIASRRMRVEAALELSDNVAQALVVARNYLDLGHDDEARHAIDGALAETQRIMANIARDDHTENLGRLYPADVMKRHDDER